MMAAGTIDWTNPNLLLVIGMAIFGITLYSMSVRRRRRNATVDARADQQSRLHHARLDTQARDDVDELMVRLEELSREICAQIDTRYAKLENLLGRAERAMESLKSAVAAPTAAAPPAAAPVDPKHAEICSLSRQGLPAIDIARRMSMAVGEVELILSLERSRRQGLPAEAASGPTSPATPTQDGRPRKSKGFDARA